MTLVGALLATDAAAESYEPEPDPLAEPDAEPDPDEPVVIAASDAQPETSAEEDEPLDDPVKDNHGAGLLNIAARATSTAVVGGPDERGHFGLGVSGMMSVLHTDEGMSGRFHNDWFLGGGAGFEGRLRGLLTFGFAPATNDTPFIRAGMGGGLEGNDAFYFSHFELPVGEAGFHHSSETFVLEIGGRAAATLTSRYRGAFPTIRGGIEPSWGAFTTLFVGPIAFDATMMRIEQDLPVTAGWGHLCAAEHVTLCVDGALYHAAPRGEDVFTSYVGLSLGVGFSGPWSREM